MAFHTFRPSRLPRSVLHNNGLRIALSRAGFSITKAIPPYPCAGPRRWMTSVYSWLPQSRSATPEAPETRVDIIPIFEDNYAAKSMVAVDPADSKTVLEVVKTIEAKEGLTLQGVLTTHKHWDHAGGNKKIAEEYPDISIIGPSLEASEIPGLTREIRDNETMEMGNFAITALSTPCHTSGHAVYLIQCSHDDVPPLLFSGDTLFVGGCGRFFEGSASDMYAALFHTILEGVPRDARIFCGHEYTVSNLRFAANIEPSNEAIAQKLLWAEKQRKANLPTIPSILSEELQYNPFLRVEVPEVMSAVGGQSPVEAMGLLRKRKNSFR